MQQRSPSSILPAIRRGRLRYASAILALSVLGLPAISHAAQVLAQREAADTPASVVPVPPGERGLRTVVAGRPIPIPGIKLVLEGPCFDRAGNLIFSDVQGSRVMRMDPQGRISTVARLGRFQPGGMAIHRDGRIFIAAGNGAGGGAILAIKPDGSGLETIVPENAGFAPNDLVFDKSDGFYFTDARGDAGNLQGGVYYVAPGAKAPVPVLQHLAVANGVALSPDGKRLWVGEYGVNRLHRLDLASATTAQPFGSVVAYYFTGPAPDSMRVDASGNVYVAIYGQGRVIVFAPSGLPIGQILLPDRDAGHHLSLTSMAIRPGTRDLFIVSANGDGTGATIFRAVAFGLGLPSREAR